MLYEYGGAHILILLCGRRVAFGTVPRVTLLVGYKTCSRSGRFLNKRLHFVLPSSPFGAARIGRRLRRAGGRAWTGGVRTATAGMSRQYNMYNVQLSEFWKQRVGKESMFNAPYLTGADDSEYDVASEAPSRAPSQLSSTSTVTQQKVRSRARKRIWPTANW